MNLTPESILEKASNSPKTMVVAAAENIDILLAVKDAMDKRIVLPLLVGNMDKISALASAARLDLSKAELLSSPSPEASVEISLKLVAEKKAHILMKGLVNSAVFLKTALKKEYAIRGSGLLSHIALFFPSFSIFI